MRASFKTQLCAASIQRLFAGRVAPDGTLVADNFARWFDQSKVLTETGSPLRLFHATHHDFSEFQVSPAGYYGGGIYLLDDPKECGEFFGDEGDDTIVPVFVRLLKPFIFDAPRPISEESDRALARVIFSGQALRRVLGELERTSDMKDLFRAELVRLGFDGLIVNQYRGPTEYIAFQPQQLKSALGNSGLFTTSADLIDSPQSVEAHCQLALAIPESEDLDLVGRNTAAWYGCQSRG